MKEIIVPLRGGRSAKLQEPERDDFDGNLSGAVQYAFAKVIVWIAKTSGQALGSFGGEALVSFLETIEPTLVKYYSPIIDELLELPDMPLFFQEFLEALRSPEHEAASTVLNAVLGSAAGGATGSLLGAVLALPTYAVNRQFEPARPTPVEALSMDWRMPGYDELALGWLKDTGWSEELQAGFREILRPRPGVGDLIAWAWREHQDPEAARSEMVLRGYKDEDIDRAMLLAKALPAPGDLVRFALREVWRDDLRPELLTPDAPSLYYELMKKQGYSQERAEDFWAAHWMLPSPGQGVEMFWRLDDFTETDLRQLLTRLDILPRYHDELIQIAYRPYTRVDVRRMHAVGVIDDAGLLRAYKDIGFDDEKAQAMTDFTIAYNRATDDEFTKAEILSGFREGMLNFENAVGLLVDMGKSEDYAMYVLALEEYKRIKKLITERVRYVKTLYVAGELDRTGASMKLAELNLEPDRIDRYIEEWDIARTAKIAKPTLARIEEWYKEDVINEATARRELTKRRYQDYTIAWYIRDWDTQIVEAARVEEARAQAEQERIAKAKFRTGRQVKIAGFNVEIATLRLAIAELKVLEHDTEYAEEYKQIKAEIARLYMLYWKVDTDEEREQIMARIDDLVEQAGLQDTLIVAINRDMLIAKRDIALKQLEKAQVPIVP